MAKVRLFVEPPKDEGPPRVQIKVRELTSGHVGISAISVGTEELIAWIGNDGKLYLAMQCVTPGLTYDAEGRIEVVK